TERSERVIEHFIRITGKFFYLLDGKTAEVTHLMTKVYVMFFVTGFLRSVCSKHQALSYFLNIIIVFIVEIKCCRQAVRFIQMIYIWFESDLIKQFGAAYPQQNKLCHFRGHICIVQPVRNGLGNVIVLRNIGRKQE